MLFSSDYTGSFALSYILERRLRHAKGKLRDFPYHLKRIYTSVIDSEGIDCMRTS